MNSKERRFCCWCTLLPLAISVGLLLIGYTFVSPGGPSESGDCFELAEDFMFCSSKALLAWSLAAFLLTVCAWVVRWCSSKRNVQTSEATNAELNLVIPCGMIHLFIFGACLVAEFSKITDRHNLWRVERLASTTVILSMIGLGVNLLLILAIIVRTRRQHRAMYNQLPSSEEESVKLKGDFRVQPPAITWLMMFVSIQSVSYVVGLAINIFLVLSETKSNIVVAALGAIGLCMSLGGFLLTLVVSVSMVYCVDDLKEEPITTETSEPAIKA